MEVTQLGRSGLVVSRLALGAMNFGTPGWGCDAETAANIVAAYRDAGGNVFDTADVYGGGASEEILGSLLAGCRDEVVICTKVGLPTTFDPNGRGTSAKHVRTALEASLRRLGTDYIDLYQVHHYDRSVPIDETLGALDDAIRAGLVRYSGCSNFFAWQIAESHGKAEARGLPRFVSAQMMYNLVRRDIEREHFGVASALGLGLIAYSPLLGGMLAMPIASRDEIPADSRMASSPEVYLNDEARVFAVNRALVAHAQDAGILVAQLALSWVARNPAIATTLIAGQSVEELQQQLAVFDLEIADDLLASLSAATTVGPDYPRDFYERLYSRSRVHDSRSNSVYSLDGTDTEMQDQVMTDEVEITNLLYRYAELVNTGRFDEVGELFAHGRVRIDGNPTTYEGAETVAEMYRSTTNVPVDRPDSLLFTTNTQIYVAGDTARAKSYWVALHQRPGVILPVASGRYNDHFKRIDGAWEFRERLMFVDLLGDLGEHLHGPIDDYLPGRSGE